MNRTSHHRDADVAAYVSGAMTPRRRRRFERHLLDCERCWQEAREDHEGRRFAEVAREVAPADLRDSVRASVAADGHRGRPKVLHRPRRATAAIAVAVGLVIVAVGTGLFLERAPVEPRPIEAALDAYHAGEVNRTTLLRTPDFGVMGLEVTGSERMSLAGMPVEAFSYRSPSGSMLSVYMAHSPFPSATEATPEPTALPNGWRAERDGMQMICSNAETSYLVVTSDPALADRFAGALSSGQIVID